MAKKPRQPRRVIAEAPRQYDPVADYLARLIVIEGDLGSGTLERDPATVEAAIVAAMDGWAKPQLGAGFPADLAHDLVLSARDLPVPRNVSEGLPLVLSAIRLYPRCIEAFNYLAELTEGVLGTDWDFCWTAAILSIREQRLLPPDNPRGASCMRAMMDQAFKLQSLGHFEDAGEWARRAWNYDPRHRGSGLRMVAVAAAIISEDRDFLARLLEEPGEPASAESRYANALARYLLEGDSPAAREDRDAGIALMPRLGEYLSGSRKLPRTVPEDAAAIRPVLATTILSKAIPKLPGVREWLTGPPAR